MIFICPILIPNMPFEDLTKNILAYYFLEKIRTKLKKFNKINFKTKNSPIYNVEFENLLCCPGLRCEKICEKVKSWRCIRNMDLSKCVPDREE